MIEFQSAQKTRVKHSARAAQQSQNDVTARYINGTKTRVATIVART